MLGRDRDEEHARALPPLLRRVGSARRPYLGGHVSDLLLHAHVLACDAVEPSGCRIAVKAHCEFRILRLGLVFWVHRTAEFDDIAHQEIVMAAVDKTDRPA